MSFNNVLLGKVYQMYIDERFGYNPICQDCKECAENNSKSLRNGPIPLFHVGKDFENAELRLMIVGKVAIGWGDIIPYFDLTWDKIFSGDLEEAENVQEVLSSRIWKLFNDNKNRYYGFIGSALTNFFGSKEHAFDRVALSNFVHCNDGEKYDNLPQKVRKSCADISANGFLHKEIEILNPTHILFLTGVNGDYQKYIDGYNLKAKNRTLTHPSARGLLKQGFSNDVCAFLNT